MGEALVGVGDAVTLHARERRERVGLRLVRPHEVENGVTACGQRVRDERAVATPGDRFRAHDRHGPGIPRERAEVVQRGRELWTLHVIREPPEARVPPRGVVGVGSRLAQTPQRLHVLVANPLPRQLRAQGFAVELRRMPRARNGADIDQQMDPDAPQDFHQLLEGAGGVPDRVQPHDRGDFTGQ